MCSEARWALTLNKTRPSAKVETLWIEKSSSTRFFSKSNHESIIQRLSDLLVTQTCQKSSLPCPLSRSSSCTNHCTTYIDWLRRQAVVSCSFSRSRKQVDMSLGLAHSSSVSPYVRRFGREDAYFPEKHCRSEKSTMGVGIYVWGTLVCSFTQKLDSLRKLGPTPDSQKRRRSSKLFPSIVRCPTMLVRNNCSHEPTFQPVAIKPQHFNRGCVVEFSFETLVRLLLWTVFSEEKALHAFFLSLNQLDDLIIGRQWWHYHVYWSNSRFQELQSIRWSYMVSLYDVSIWNCRAISW